jgi:hypothetical protein
MQLTNWVEAEILSDIELIRKDGKLWLEKNFIARSEAIDHLEFHVIDRINALLEISDSPERMNVLKQDAIRVRSDLEEVNARMFHLLRTKISRDNYRGQRLMKLLEDHLDRPLSSFLQSETIGYDHLDLLLNGILTHQNLPIETRDREPEMVFYQKTPARIIFELIKKAAFKPGDVFFDLGSGLGQVVILTNLLASVISTGVEYEPAFCAYAGKIASDLNLDQVNFINIDARHADYSTGTVFFMYTPFEGKMLRDIIQKLHREAKKRKIRIFSYGPCTREVAQEEWLIKASGSTVEFGEFRTA